MAAVIAVAASAAAFVAVELDPNFDNTTSESTEPVAVSELGFGFWIVLAIWVALIIYALILLPETKRVLAARDATANTRRDTNGSASPHSQPLRQPTAAPRHRTNPTAPPPPAAPKQDEVLGAYADNYLAMGPPGNTSPSTPPNAPPWNGTSRG